MSCTSPGALFVVALACLLQLSSSGGSPLSSPSPSCNPFVCVCTAGTDGPKTLGGRIAAAICSRRGLLSIPPALPESLADLDLSHNDLTLANVTELARLENLESLDLSSNQLSAFAFFQHWRLSRLDLSNNNFSSVRSLRLDGLAALKELRLANNKIISLPPNAFSFASVLRTLDLKGNSIISLEPGCLDNLTALEELILTKNRLSSFPKGLFQGMKNLQVLELNKNKFVEIQGLSFHGLDNLRTLRLKRNQIEFLMDGAFFGLHKIEVLELDRNRVSGVDKGWLYGLYTLQTLSLAFNRVDFIAEDGWEFCRLLQELDLRGNNLLLLERDMLRMLPQLRHLHLQENKISHIEDEDTFAEVPLLESLALDANEISHTIEDMRAPFVGLQNLRTLSLSQNQIKSVGDHAFDGLESLEELRLDGNVISTVQENAFAHLPHLRVLSLNSSSMLCDCYLKWFPSWINATGVTGCSATCAHPESLKDRLITSVAYESFTCDDFPKPYILQQPRTQITLRSSDLTLMCRAASTSSAEMSFQWKKDGEVVDYAEREDCAKSQQRCMRHISHSFDGKGREITSELRLTNLTYDDAGKYQCVVSNKFGATYSEKANITVYVFPQFVATPDDITVEGASTATLRCAARGVPAPKVLWSKDAGSDFPAATERRIAVSSQPIGDDKYTTVNGFVIYGVKAKDMGVYTCKASNPAGSITWNITLSVLEVPRFVKPMESKSVAEGDTAVIECMASGSPKPRLTWTKDGGQLEATERHFFTADNQLLIIVKARQSDAGRYECTMHNQLGTESQSSTLTIEGASAGGIFSKGDADSNSGSLSSTATIVIVAVVICVVATLLVWVAFCCRQRRRRQPAKAPVNMDSSRRSLVVSAASPDDSGFDIHEHVRREIMCYRPEVGGRFSPSSTQDAVRSHTTLLAMDFKDEERDSGTGDSKRSNGDRNERDEVEDRAEERDRERAALLLCPKQGGGESAMSLSEFDLRGLPSSSSSLSLAASNQALAAIRDDIPFADDDEEAAPASGASSDVSSSLLNQGGGEGRFEDDLSLTVSSSSNPGASTATHRVQAPAPPEQAHSAFRTFLPRASSRQRQFSDLANANGSELALNALSPSDRSGKKRASAIELNGHCYLAIEPEASGVSTELEAAVYRGGIGTLPRSSLEFQERLLAASLQSCDYLGASRLSQQQQQQQQPLLGHVDHANRGSRTSLRLLPTAAKARKNRGSSLPRKYKRCVDVEAPKPERSAVGGKNKELF